MGKRTKQKLTNARCAAFKCGKYEKGKLAGQEKQQDVLWDGGDGSVKGLGLRYSSKTGTRTFMFVGRVRHTKREVYVTLGRLEDGWTLGGENPAWDPRVKAGELRKLMAQGIDPVAQQERERAAKRATDTTLRQIVDLYVQSKTLRPSTIADIRKHCTRNLAGWLDLPVASITKAMCLEKFLHITRHGATGKGAPHQGNACMVYLRALLNFARDHHATPTGEFPVLPVNPVTQMWKTQDRNPETPRNRAVPLQRVGHVWNLLREKAGDTGADLLSTIYLTAMRVTECSTLRWQDVNFEKRTITRQAEHVKTKNLLVVPMSDLLIGILQARQPKEEKPTAFVFPSDVTKTGYVSSPRYLMERVAEVAECVEVVNGKTKYLLSPHDFRRTADGIGQACKVDSDTRRMILNHKTGDVHFKAYASRQGLAAAYDAIAQYVHEAATVAASKNVIQFPFAKTG